VVKIINLYIVKQIEFLTDYDFLHRKNLREYKKLIEANEISYGKKRLKNRRILKKNVINDSE